MAAYWYRQMGFVNVFVLQGGLRTWSEGGETLVSGAIQNEPLSFEAAKRRARSIEARDLERKLRDSATLVLDVGTSLEFESAHVPGAKWISRGWIELKLPQKIPDRTQPIVVTCPDGQQSVFAARALVEIGYTDVCRIGRAACAHGRRPGFQRSRESTGCLVQPNDVVLVAVDSRHEGRYAALSWIGKLDTETVIVRCQQLSYFGLANVFAVLVAMSKRSRGISVRSLP